jgi:hypothetical protein
VNDDARRHSVQGNNARGIPRPFVPNPRYTRESYNNNNWNGPQYTRASWGADYDDGQGRGNGRNNLPGVSRQVTNHNQRGQSNGRNTSFGASRRGTSHQLRQQPDRNVAPGVSGANTNQVAVDQTNVVIQNLPIDPVEVEIKRKTNMLADVKLNQDSLKMLHSMEEYGRERGPYPVLTPTHYFWVIMYFFKICENVQLYRVSSYFWNARTRFYQLSYIRSCLYFLAVLLYYLAQDVDVYCVTLFILVISIPVLGYPWILARLGPIDVRGELTALARDNHCDIECLSYAIKQMGLVPRNTTTARECKLKVDQWIKLHRKNWTELENLEQVINVTRVAMESRLFDEVCFDTWSMPGSVDWMNTVTSWVKTGHLPDGSIMPIK